MTVKNKNGETQSQIQFLLSVIVLHFDEKERRCSHIAGYVSRTTNTAKIK